MIRSKKQSYIIVGAFIIMLMLFTTTYAFFNYTRTGTANVIKTGRIYFNSTQGDDVVTLSDLFPITLAPNEEITAQTPGVGSLKLHITGDTSYSEGIEYLVEAVEVTGNGQTALPISIAISYTPTEVEQGQDPNVIGTSDQSYFTNRGGNTSRYKLLSTGSITEGEDILVGYIAPGNTGIDGELTILAYLDASDIAITDTYPEGTVHTVITTGYSSSDCETVLTGDANASTYCATAADLQDAIDNGDLTNGQISALVTAGIVEEYTDGTTSNWVNNRTVFTTEEWNALQASGVSFKIKTTANEGIWVTNPGSATLSLSPASGTADIGNADPTVTSTITTNGNGTLSCVSSSDAIATCSINNNTLTVTGVTEGTATITVTEAAGTLFSTPATATFEATVIDSTPVEP